MSLIERARANDPESWERIVYLYSPLVYAWCRRFGLQDADTLDVSQDVMRSVYLSLGIFRKAHPNDSFRKWLKTITRNRVLDFLRRKGRAPAATGGDEHPEATISDIDDSPEDCESEQKTVLRRALEMVRAEFTPQTWDAFWRVTVDETPAGDVATTLGISTNAVYLAKSRVLRRLSDQFAELIDGLAVC